MHVGCMQHEVIIAGGSIAGAALAFSLAKLGKDVCVVEASTEFRDRVRGEGIHPWGMHEVERLGLQDVVRGAGGVPNGHWDTYVGGALLAQQDLATCHPAGCVGLNAHHPELQEALLTAAGAAGAKIMRGARVTAIELGARPEVVVEDGTNTQRWATELIVVADGRNSRLRARLGLSVAQTPSPMQTSGVLVSGVPLSPGRIASFYPPELGELALWLPLSAGRSRLYACQRVQPALRGGADGALARVLERCAALGVPAEWTDSARAIGPCATVLSFYRSVSNAAPEKGVVLIGDVAGNVDPVFGCGLSLALRDARHLYEFSRAGDSLSAAAAQYASARARYYPALVRVEQILHRALFAPAPSVIYAARLAEAGIDLFGLGPESPTDAATERAIFA